MTGKPHVAIRIRGWGTEPSVGRLTESKDLYLKIYTSKYACAYMNTYITVYIYITVHIYINIRWYMYRYTPNTHDIWCNIYNIYYVYTYIYISYMACKWLAMDISISAQQLFISKQRISTHSSMGSTCRWSVFVLGLPVHWLTQWPWTVGDP